MDSPQIHSKAVVMFAMSPRYEVAERDRLSNVVSGGRLREAAKVRQRDRGQTIVKARRWSNWARNIQTGCCCRIDRAIGKEVCPQRMATVPRHRRIVLQPPISNGVACTHVVVVGLTLPIQHRNQSTGIVRTM